MRAEQKVHESGLLWEDIYCAWVVGLKFLFLRFSKQSVLHPKELTAVKLGDAEFLCAKVKHGEREIWDQSSWTTKICKWHCGTFQKMPNILKFWILFLLSGTQFCQPRAGSFDLSRFLSKVDASEPIALKSTGSFGVARRRAKAMELVELGIESRFSFFWCKLFFGGKLISCIFVHIYAYQSYLGLVLGEAVLGKMEVIWWGHVNEISGVTGWQALYLGWVWGLLPRICMERMEICRGSFTRRLSARQRLDWITVFGICCRKLNESNSAVIPENHLRIKTGMQSWMKLRSYEIHFTSFNQPPEFPVETVLIKCIFHKHRTSWVESCESFSQAGHVVHTCNTEKVGCLRIRDLSAMESASMGALCHLPHESLFSLGKLETMCFLIPWEDGCGSL